MSEVAVTVGGLLIGMLFGGLILFFCYRNAKKRFQETVEEEEKNWAEEEEDK